MWSSRLFWKLLLAYAGLILATASVFAALVAARQEKQVLSYLRERLHDDAVLLASRVEAEIPLGRTESIDAVVDTLARRTGTRMTVLDAAGTPLADSEQDPAMMENHLDRDEVVTAAARGVGVATHLSRTVGIPMMYLALRVDGANAAPIGFVRVALAMHSVEARLAATRRLVWGIALAVGLATLLVTYVVVARITRPLGALTAAAEALAAGQFGHKVYVPNRDELGILARAFNRMSEELLRRISQIRGDQELLATVLGGMVEGVIAIDSEQRVRFANGAARGMLGLPSDHLAGRPVWEIVPHSAVHDGVRAALDRELPIQSEFEIVGPPRRVLALYAGGLPGSPSPGAVLVFHDITELRRLESMRRDFVANVSHELKTPLASINAYAETLLAGALADAETNRSFVRQIVEQAERLHILILDLISLARIESGEQTFDIRPVALASAVAACVKQHEAGAAAKPLELTVDPPVEPLDVLADDEGVHEILNNLLDNAIKNTPAGGRVRVRWRQAGDDCVIEVADTGIGIAPHEQSRIFERFYRVDKARSREQGGTGLGLSIVKHLALSFSGTIDVTSEVGRGSTFFVRLPLA